MSNKSIGAAFEREFAEFMSDRGFWVHILQDNRNGQPFDVIAARNGYTYVFDCKVCEGNTFLLSRMEPNQISAMKLWEGCGNEKGMFVIAYRKASQFCTIPFDRLMKLKEEGIKSLSIERAVQLSIEVCRWN